MPHAALLRMAAAPAGRSTIDRSELFPASVASTSATAGSESREASVAKPVHVIFYRVLQQGIIEIVRVLHQRMDPIRHIDAGTGVF